MTGSGQTGTPLARKLGVKAGHRLTLCAAPDGWEIPGLPEGATTVRLAEAPPPGAAEPADVVVAFCRAGVELAVAVARFAPVIHPAGMLWAAWPRRAGGHRSDITDNLVREVALPLGLVDTKVAALDADWSALRLVWRAERRW
jgi:hypothetical protein